MQDNSHYTSNTRPSRPPQPRRSVSTSSTPTRSSFRTHRPSFSASNSNYSTNSSASSTTSSSTASSFPFPPPPSPPSSHQSHQSQTKPTISPLPHPSKSTPNLRAARAASIRKQTSPSRKTQIRSTNLVSSIGVFFATLFGVWCLFWVSFVLTGVDDFLRSITRSALWMRAERFYESVKWEMELLWSRLNAEAENLQDFDQAPPSPPQYEKQHYFEGKERRNSHHHQPQNHQRTQSPHSYSWTKHVLIDLMTILEETLVRGKVWEPQDGRRTAPSSRPSSRPGSRRSSMVFD